jgi:hypothetical protein
MNTKVLTVKARRTAGIQDAARLPAEQAGKSRKLPPVETRFKPGTSGNPKGRPPSAGATIREWFNTMQNWTAVEIRRAMDDERQPAAKRAAAAAWLAAMSEGGALDRIIDRTEGKAVARLEISGTDGDAIQIEQRVTDLKTCLELFDSFNAQKLPNTEGTV